MSHTSASKPLRILFVCVGNSCRSQMAEAMARYMGGGHVVAYSAGSAPLGRIAAPTYEIMAEKGISLDGQWSKSLADVPASDTDVTVSMGCEVVCPVPLNYRGKILEWDIPDPFNSSLESYRAARDLIERELLDLFKALNLTPVGLPGGAPRPATGEDSGAS